MFKDRRNEIELFYRICFTAGEVLVDWYNTCYSKAVLKKRMVAKVAALLLKIYLLYACLCLKYSL